MGYETIVVLSLVAAPVAILAVLNLLDGRKAAKDLARFQRSFPRKCPICSFRHYGMLHGFDVGLPEQHVCPNEVARTESNRLPGQKYWTGPVDKKVVRIDVGQMTTEQAEGAIMACKDLFIPVGGS